MTIVNSLKWLLKTKARADTNNFIDLLLAFVHLFFVVPQLIFKSNKNWKLRYNSLDKIVPGYLVMTYPLTNVLLSKITKQNDGN